MRHCPHIPPGRRRSKEILRGLEKLQRPGDGAREGKSTKKIAGRSGMGVLGLRTPRLNGVMYLGSNYQSNRRVYEGRVFAPCTFFCTPILGGVRRGGGGWVCVCVCVCVVCVYVCV